MIMVPMFANVCQLSCVMNNQTEMKNPVQKQTELCFPFFFMFGLGNYGIMETYGSQVYSRYIFYLIVFNI